MLKVQVVHFDSDNYYNVKNALEAHFEVFGLVVEPGDPEPSTVESCDLLVVDFEIPDVLTMVQAIRREVPNTEIILLLPVQYDFKVVSALFRYGVTECLIKPYSKTDVIAAVCKIKKLPLPDSVAPKTDSRAGVAKGRENNNGDEKVDSDGEGDGESTGEPDREEIASYLLDQTKLPMMPQIAMRIVRLCRSPSVNAEQLERIIVGDQAFAAQLLKTANSALYRRRVPVQSISQAIVRIGLKNVNNLAIGLSANSLHQQVTPRSRQLWQTSRTVASAAQVLAAPYKQAESTYVAGLLHNVGMTLLNNLDGERFEQCLEMQNEGMSLIEAEEEAFGVSHTELGFALMKKWEIDPIFGEAVASYEAPWQFKKLSKTGMVLSACINLGRTMMALPMFKNQDGEPVTKDTLDDMAELMMEQTIINYMRLDKPRVISSLEGLQSTFIQDG